MNTKELLTKIIGDIFNLSIGWNVSFSASPTEIENKLNESGQTLCGCITISGQFQGAMTFHCTSRLGQEFAADIFQVPAQSVSQAQLRDAIGEITNMIAGNYKRTLNGTSQISLPLVVSGHNFQILSPNAKIEAHLGFTYEDSIATVTLYSEPQNNQNK